ncbi:MAG: hypothetical protein HRU16_10625 [Planctomycetes bacterium]|nr:hypothetical protein [Planctomycetota bacterium]
MIQDPNSPTDSTMPEPTIDAPQVQKCGPRTTWWLCSRTDEVESSGFIQGAATLPLEGYRRGRTEHPVYRHTSGSLLMWKSCLRGGWLSHVVRDRHLRPERFVREMEMCESLNQQGIPTSQILAIAATSAGIGFRIEMLICLEVEADTLLEVLGDRSLSGSERQKILATTASAIHHFHEQGWLHGDLNLMNILIQKTGTETYRAILVDLDPGGLDPVSNRLGNLVRLVRSYRKCRREQIPPLHPGEGFRFMYGVTGGNRQLLKQLLEKTQHLLDSEEWRR